MYLKAASQHWLREWTTSTFGSHLSHLPCITLMQGPKLTPTKSRMQLGYVLVRKSRKAIRHTGKSLSQNSHLIKTLLRASAVFGCHSRVCCFCLLLSMLEFYYTHKHPRTSGQTEQYLFKSRPFCLQ